MFKPSNASPRLAGVVPMLLIVNFIPKGNLSCWKKVGAVIFLGIGLSSRANFILLLPLVFSTLVQHTGLKSASKYIALTLMIFGVVTIPFYVYDPHEFSPLHQQFNKLAQFQSILPFPAIGIPFLGATLALLLSLQRMDSTGLVLLRNSAIVQAFPILCVIVLSTIQAGSLDFSFAGYGLYFLFFGALASWASLVGKPTATSRINTAAVSVRLNEWDKGAYTS